MEDENTELKTIAMEYLYEGMILAEDIYDHSEAVLLLSKGNTLTENKIGQLREFNASKRNISVFPSTYEALINRGLNRFNTLAQEYLEEAAGYTDIKDKTGGMLEAVGTTKTVSKDSIDQIAGEMAAKLREIDPSVIFQCINAPNPIDEYLRRHSVNVGLLNGMMGRWMGLDPNVIDQVIVAGLVHDVGKTRIPVQILEAPRKLTRSEYEVMKMHPIYSFDLLKSDERFIEEIRLAARHHHEKMNGDGYPDGISADQISMFAKITAVSDIYDAMISKRAYKDAVNPFAVFSMLARQQFSELDVQLVKLFMDHMPLELIGKSVLMSDGSIGIIKYIIRNDLDYPLVDVNGEIKKTDEKFYCLRLVLDM